ncbi:hypothetical protein M8494_22465 [Serratia ureilytica]
MPLMENAYKPMQMTAQADKVAKIIAANSSNTVNGKTKRQPRLPFSFGFHWKNTLKRRFS